MTIRKCYTIWLHEDSVHINHFFSSNSKTHQTMQFKLVCVCDVFDFFQRSCQQKCNKIIHQFDQFLVSLLNLDKKCIWYEVDKIIFSRLMWLLFNKTVALRCLKIRKYTIWSGFKCFFYITQWKSNWWKFSTGTELQWTSNFKKKKCRTADHRTTYCAEHHCCYLCNWSWKKMWCCRKVLPWQSDESVWVGE